MATSAAAAARLAPGADRARHLLAHSMAGSALHNGSMAHRNNPLDARHSCILAEFTQDHSFINSHLGALGGVNQAL